MNAENMGFEPGSYDFALCGFMGWDDYYDFVLNEFTGPDPRMQEIYRVLRTGGRVGLSSWEKQADLDWMQDILIEHFPSIVTRRNGESAEQPLVYSKENPAGIEQILTSAGFNNIQVFKETTEFVSPDEETWWRQMRSVGWYRYFEELSADELIIFKKIVFNDLRALKHEDGIHFSKTVIFVSAEKTAVQDVAQQ